MTAGLKPCSGAPGASPIWRTVLIRRRRVSNGLRHDLANFKTRLKALEKKKQDDEACGEIETVHPGYLGSQDRFRTNGICERFHKTILQEFCQIAFRRKLCDSIDALQADLDAWLHHYNHERRHQGKMCCGRTPFETMIEGKEIWKEKFVT